ncbi:sugar ABC transporter permease, partial [Blautia pseudococcoides]|nr:sugar ABC transporter permease [Blautia pseudococcoides]
MKKSVPKKTTGKQAQSRRLFYCIVPFIVLCFLFSYFPLHGWLYAFFDYKPPLKLSQCDFVGWKWFRTLFTNTTQIMQMFQVMKNTFAMSLLGIFTSILPMGFAVFLNEIKCKWFKNLVQTLTTLPNFISWVLVYSVAFSLFTDSGMVNTWLQNMGIITTPVKFLDSDTHVWLWMTLWNI